MDPSLRRNWAPRNNFSNSLELEPATTGPYFIGTLGDELGRWDEPIEATNPPSSAIPPAECYTSPASFHGSQREADRVSFRKALELATDAA